MSRSYTSSPPAPPLVLSESALLLQFTLSLTVYSYNLSGLARAKVRISTLTSTHCQWMGFPLFFVGRILMKVMNIGVRIDLQLKCVFRITVGV
jgi:hypothetical protein